MDPSGMIEDSVTKNYNLVIGPRRVPYSYTISEFRSCGEDEEISLEIKNAQIEITDVRYVGNKEMWIGDSYWWVLYYWQFDPKFVYDVVLTCKCKGSGDEYQVINVNQVEDPPLQFDFQGHFLGAGT